MDEQYDGGDEIFDEHYSTGLAKLMPCDETWVKSLNSQACAGKWNRQINEELFENLRGKPGKKHLFKKIKGESGEYELDGDRILKVVKRKSHE